MAGAIIRGACASGLLAAEDIGAFDLETKKTDALQKELGIVPFATAQELIAQCAAVVLAVKPNIFPSLLSSLAPVIQSANPLLISIAAGKQLADIEEYLGFLPKLVRVMPNINAKTQAAMSAYCPNSLVSPTEEAFVSDLLNAIGKGIRLDESYFPLFGVIAGCAPAFAFMFIDALARAGVKNGMAKQQALEIAAQTVLGSAKMILDSGEHPWALIDAVCSPGGTTIEGVAKLEELGLDTAIIKAVDAALEKDAKI